ncbi:hypothetical protein Golax_023957, partial [Gossypium laxum]|nr:hypothetical protein [Gossypium laxum]
MVTTSHINPTFEGLIKIERVVLLENREKDTRDLKDWARDPKGFLFRAEEASTKLLECQVGMGFNAGVVCTIGDIQKEPKTLQVV